MNKLKILQKMEHIVTRHWKLEQLSRICVREIVSALDCDECAIMQISDQGVIILANKGMLGNKKEIKSSAALDKFRSSPKSIITGDVANCTSVPGVPCGSFVNSGIWTPIIIDSVIGGMLYAGAYTKQAFNAEDRQFLEELAGDIATAFSYSLSVRSDDEMLDKTTGVYNQKLFDSDITGMLASAGDCFSLIMLDIDDFPQYIEFYGASAANRLLKNLVPLLTNNMRPLDRFYRYGDNEFVILLEGLEKPMAVAVAQRLNNLVAQTSFPGKELSEPGHYITISAGVAGYPDDAPDISGLIKSLYASLSQAKQSGGNKVCHFEITG